MNKFEVGKTYQTRSICDHDCLITMTVVDRTAKTVRMVEGDGKAPLKLNGDNKPVKTFRPRTSDNGVEFIWPWGHYSMSPLLDATDLVVSL
jgi:hypothetical protein